MTHRSGITEEKAEKQSDKMASPREVGEKTKTIDITERRQRTRLKRV
jgi:hypothetical protein